MPKPAKQHALAHGLSYGPPPSPMGSERLRCGLRALMASSRAPARRAVVCLAGYALPIVMMLAAAPTHAFAESLVCHPIQRGESATHVARRITGDSRNTYQAWF